MEKKKRIVIIGAGLSGLGSIKACKEEPNLEPICFEKTPDLCGTWCYREEPIEGLPSIMWTTIINHSKEMGSISNYVYPDEYPNYMRHTQVYEYYMKMAVHFDILRHITCNREVVQVEKSDDYDLTGRWKVTVKNTENGELGSDIYDGVLCCTGQFTYPHMPTFSGMDKYRGKILHSHDLKRVDGFAGKRVVVVGIGCSALDAAVEISNVAQQVYLSVRTPSWILPRVGPYGLPSDYALIRRYGPFLQKIFPLKWLSRYVERSFIETKFNHKLYGLEPKHPFLSRVPIVNDILPCKIQSGGIIIKKNVSRFEEDGVVFDEENELVKADVVILATGYSWKFHYLKEDMIQIEDNRINLYKCVYPSQLKYPTLAIIGLILPLGPGFPLGELQTRWAVHLLSGKGCLPSVEEMREDVKRRYEENSKRYPPSDKMSLFVDNAAYSDELGSQFGVKPNFWKMMFTDYKLWKACVFGPFVPYQYRLVGPHKWDGARNAILTAYHRMRRPLSGKPIETKCKPSKSHVPLLKNILLILLAMFLVSWKQTAMRYYMLGLAIPYYFTLKTFFAKYLFILVLLPFYVNYPGFTANYFVTLFVPFTISLFTP